MAVTALRRAIGAQLVGRDREAYLIALALVAREHVLLVGPPGTAKSHLCRVGAAAVDGARYVERLLSPTTAPEAIWGPVSISALREDRYEHVTAGYAADAHVLYLDEVGRASPAILDTLLHLLGPERQALIGTKNVAAPLVAAIGSANTWPEDAAMMDRWLLRATVNYLTPRERRTLLTFDPPPMVPVMTLEALTQAHATAKALTWSKSALDAFEKICDELDDAGVTVSDRRFKASDKVARAAAVLAGHTMVLPMSLSALQFVLWNTPAQAPTVAEIVARHSRPLGGRLTVIADETRELDIQSRRNPNERQTVLAKLCVLAEEVAAMANSPEAVGADDSAIGAEIEATAKLLHTAIKRTNARIAGLDETKVGRTAGGIQAAASAAP